ncbi:hypothetical protein BDZ89DRAFT_1071394 [Hymenopellis radicata]|nr:hypothetical protein BDZ89DRAFT_1071394 [Hymenopellis radicata]
MATRTDPETIKPKIRPLTKEKVKALGVYHPTHNCRILVFGCRTQRGTSMMMSRMLVQQAAAIVAGTDGFLSKSKDRGGTPETDALIPAGKYFFHAANPTFANYAICADFNAWVPPEGPDQLPEPWKSLTKTYNELDIPPLSCGSSQVTHWVKEQDKICLLTGDEDLVECQHFVPQEHAVWADHFHLIERATQNIYTLPNNISRAIDDVRCLGSMNPYAHRLMDTGLYCPFPVPDAAGAYTFVAYYVAYVASTSGLKHHLRDLNTPTRISPYILFVRFAWTVFKLVPQNNEAVARKPVPLWALNINEQIGDAGSGAGTGGGEIGGAGIGGASGASGHEEDAPSMVSDNSMSADDIERRELNLDSRLLQLFSDIEAGKINSPALFYEYAIDYPGMGRIARLREEYVKEHPQVFSTGDPTTLRLV